MSTAQLKPENLQPLQINSGSQQPIEIYHLSHDLRGPLNSILGFAELLYEGIEGPVNDIQMEDLAAIKQSAQNLLRLINTIVDLSKLDAGRMTLNEDSVVMSNLVGQIIELDLAPTNRPEIWVDLPESLSPVKGDLERVRQIIYNILDYGLTQKKSSQITITADQDATSVTLNIAITGVELSPEKTAALLTLTVAVDAAGRSELGPGGLMLPLAKQLAVHQQGQLWANNTDTGTDFALKLPRYEMEDG